MALDYRESAKGSAAPQKGRKSLYKAKGKRGENLSGSVRDSLKSDNIIQLPTLSMKEQNLAWEQLLEKDVGFSHIFSGQIKKLKHPWKTIKCQVSEKDGRLWLCGKPYQRSKYSWRIPKTIWIQGRTIKEESNKHNNNPKIRVLVNGALVWLDKCPCGGELLMDNNENLYCSKCSLIYE
jgi:hypothetical protein